MTFDAEKFQVGKTTTFLGMPAVVKKVEGTIVTYELGEDRIVVTVDMASGASSNRASNRRAPFER